MAITTHVLNTFNGQPGRGMSVQLYWLGDNGRELIISTNMNQDGRCDAPLVEGESMRSGIYELDFAVGDYFAAVTFTKPPFLDIVTLRFGVADINQKYHIPLLVSPYSYSTYRGS